MVSINYKLSGNPNGKKIVLLNGLFTDLQSYEGVVPFLEDEFHILRYDARGQGESEHPVLPEYTLSDHVSDLASLLDCIKWESAFFVGISFGARIALSFGQQFPQRVSAIVAADTYDEVTPLLQMKFNSWLRAFDNGGAQLRFDIASPWVWGESMVSKESPLYNEYRKKAATHPPHAVKALINGAMKGDIDVAKIEAPVYVVVGSEDLLTPPAYGQKMMIKLKRGKIDLVPGGHASLLEHPEIFKTHIIPFLRGV